MRVHDWLRLREAAMYYYKQTGHIIPTTDTIHKWIKSGKNDYEGKRVYLRAEWRLNARITREKWMDEFIGKIQRREIGDTVQGKE